MRTVAFILKGYPRLSETFIAQEIHALEQRGLHVEIISLRHPTDSQTHPVHRDIDAAVHYLPEYLHHEPFRVLRALIGVCRRDGFGTALRIWWRDLGRDKTRNRVRRFGQALVLAHELPSGVEHLHAHFLHTPASVTRYAAIMTRLPWSVSAHAKDIWTTPDWDKREKLADCAWAVTCTGNGLHHLAQLSPPDRVSLVYHGLDLSRFAPPSMDHSQRDGSAMDDPVVILCVGRAVPKKGLDTLVSALAQMPPDITWRLVHIGDGPQLDHLKKMAAELGLEDRIQWLGPQPQEVVLANYRTADVFVLPSVVADDGDRDGLPNVLLEAHSQGLPCISSHLPGVAELIADGISGLLTPPGDAASLAQALTAVASDPRRRQQMGRAAMARVRDEFSLDEHISRLATLFGLSPANENSAPCELHSTLP